MNDIASLDDINLEPGIIYETIVTTLNPDGRPNAAAIGVTRVEGDKLELTVFQGSNTFENLKTTDTFGINMLETDQYALAIQAALKGWGDGEPEFELSEFEFQQEEVQAFKQKYGLARSPIIYIGNCNASIYSRAGWL